MGKGSTPRPYSVSRDEFADKWEQTFGKRQDDPDPYTELQEQTIALLPWIGVVVVALVALALFMLYA